MKDDCPHTTSRAPEFRLDQREVPDMKHLSRLHHILTAIALAFLLPLGMATAQDIGRVNEVNPSAGFSSVSRAYADMDKTYARIGTKRRLAQVRQMKVGMSRKALQAALGRPAIAYSDGSYEFHLSLHLSGADRLICQYRVFMADDDTVERAVWRRPQCAELVFGQRH